LLVLTKGSPSLLHISHSPLLPPPLIFCRVDSYLESAQISLKSEDEEEKEDWKKPFVESYLLQLTTSHVHHLPMALSPLSLVLLLVASNYLIDASSIYWKILQLPRAAFRNDVASQILKDHLHSSPSPSGLLTPYYLTCLPEVESGGWGWKVPPDHRVGE
jgi:hypothetical protein